MHFESRHRSLVLCALSALICNAALYLLSEHHFRIDLRTAVDKHLTAALDESLFSDDKGRVNDAISIAYVARQINHELSDWVSRRWYAAIVPRHITVQVIDGVTVDSPANLRGGRAGISISIPRNGQLRAVSIGYRLERRWPAHLAVTILALATYLSTRRWAPPSLTALQRYWLQRLVDARYDSSSARMMIAPRSENQLALTAQQLELFELLHIPAQRNFAFALSTALDKRALPLTALDRQWFVTVLKQTRDVEAAWQTATCENRVVVDLVNARLCIRGRNIDITKTPLFYYAWYALKRLQDDGWTLNPPSNRPDRKEGAELAELMWKHKGHAKAISELEHRGLRAKTLDQNRSKIKEELLAALGPELAEHYLFDTQKDSIGRICYRLKPAGIFLEVIETSAPVAEFKQRA